MALGQEVALRTYEPVYQTWRLTRAGLAFYSKMIVRYVIKWPSQDDLPSTATILGQVLQS